MTILEALEKYDTIHLNGDEMPHIDWYVGKDSCGIPVRTYKDPTKRLPDDAYTLGNVFIISKEWQEYTLPLTNHIINLITNLKDELPRIGEVEGAQFDVVIRKIINMNIPDFKEVAK